MNKDYSEFVKRMGSFDMELSDDLSSGYLDEELRHHGIKGQKWGVRRFQNKDGSLTAAGKRRQAKAEYKSAEKSAFDRYERSIKDVESGYKRGQTLSKRDLNRQQAIENRYRQDVAAAKDNYRNTPEVKARRDAAKKAVKVGAVVAGTVLVAYGAHKVMNNPKAIAAGKKAVANMMAPTGNIKNTIKSTTEYKIASAVGKGVKTHGGKVIDTLGSEKLGRAITGVGAMAGTGALLKTQVNDLKNVRGEEGTNFDKTMSLIKKTSAIGESVNTLAKGPMNQPYKVSGNNGGNNGGNNKGGNDLLTKTRDLKSVVGEPKGIFGAEAEKQYQGLFRNNPTDEQRALIKAMRKNGYGVDQIEQYVFHGDVHDNELYHNASIGKAWILGL